MKKSAFSYIKRVSYQLKSVYPTDHEQQSVAWVLLEKVTGLSQTALIAQKELTLSQEQENQLKNYINEHTVLHKPLNYIIGFVPFVDLEIIVEPPILIPRPETEQWIVDLIALLKKLQNKEITVLDLCTGSGVIALALAKALPQAKIYAVDSEQHALTLAQKNADLNAINTITFLQSDLFSQLSPGIMFDLIVTNPPYISEQEFSSLEPMVKNWEDKKALVAQEHGLYIIQRIIEESPHYLRYNQELVDQDIGQIYIEIGYQQGDAIKKILHDAGYTKIKIKKDYAGHDRVAIARFMAKGIDS